jgi:hypothetical protein
MPTLSETLQSARHVIAGGWVEPNSLDADGKLCTFDSEGLTRVCVDDALAIACAGDGALHVAAELELQQQLRLTGDTSALTNWLTVPTRTKDDVLRLFARAQAHAHAGESR